MLIVELTPLNDEKHNFTYHTPTPKRERPNSPDTTSSQYRISYTTSQAPPAHPSHPTSHHLTPNLIQDLTSQISHLDGDRALRVPQDLEQLARPVAVVRGAPQV